MFRSAACLALGLVLFSCAAEAQETTTQRVIEGDVLLIDRASRTHATARLPDRGMLMSQVESQFGAPSERRAAVGGGSAQTPPITRWVYPDFTVYFENNHVVNAVVNRASPLEKGPKRTGQPNG